MVAFQIHNSLRKSKETETVFRVYAKTIAAGREQRQVLLTQIVDFVFASLIEEP